MYDEQPDIGEFISSDEFQMVIKKSSDIQFDYSNIDLKRRSSVAYAASHNPGSF